MCIFLVILTTMERAPEGTMIRKMLDVLEASNVTELELAEGFTKAEMNCLDATRAIAFATVANLIDESRNQNFIQNCEFYLEKVFTSVCVPQHSFDLCQTKQENWVIAYTSSSGRFYTYLITVKSATVVFGMHFSVYTRCIRDEETGRPKLVASFLNPHLSSGASSSWYNGADWRFNDQFLTNLLMNC